MMRLPQRITGEPFYEWNLMERYIPGVGREYGNILVSICDNPGREADTMEIIDELATAGVPITFSQITIHLTILYKLEVSWASVHRLLNKLSDQGILDCVYEKDLDGEQIVTFEPLFILR
jgi:hypothetical protein